MQTKRFKAPDAYHIRKREFSESNFQRSTCIFYVFHFGLPVRRDQRNTENGIHRQGTFRVIQGQDMIPFVPADGNPQECILQVIHAVAAVIIKNAFAVSAFAASYVNDSFAIVPVPPFALKATV